MNFDISERALVSLIACLVFIHCGEPSVQTADTCDSPKKNEDSTSFLYQIDGCRNDWSEDQNMIHQLGGIGRGNQNRAIDIRRVYLDNDEQYLYMFFECVPSVQKRFEEKPDTGSLGIIYVDTDHDSKTGCRNVKPLGYTSIDGYEFKINMPLGISGGLKPPHNPFVSVSIEPFSDGSNEPGPAVFSVNSDESKFVHSGAAGVEMAVPLQKLGLQSPGPVRFLFEESAHNSDETGYKETTFHLNIDLSALSKRARLFYAAQTGNLSLLEKQSLRKMDLNSRNDQGRTPLIAAVKNQHPDIVEKLISAGADINVPSENGTTALMEAAKQKNVKMAKRLIEAGADVNTRNNGHFTPIMFAALSGQDKMVKLLLDEGAEVNVETKYFDGRSTFFSGRRATALFFAAYEGHPEIVQMLLDAGARVNHQAKLRTIKGYTPLMIASAAGHPECVKILIENGARVERKNSHGKTALDIARNHNNKGISQILDKKTN